MQHRLKKLQKNSVIQQLTAGLLVLLFTFSITPKQYLHDLIVQHQDDYSITKKGDQQQVNKVGFQCDCNNQVVQLPYIAHPDFQLSHPAIQHLTVLIHLTYGYTSAEKRFSSLRGPPVTA